MRACLCAVFLVWAFQTQALCAPYTFVTIDYPDAQFTAATGINNSGEIVGIQSTDSPSPVFAMRFTSFRYSDGSITPLLVPGAFDGSTANGINNLGQIVGGLGDASGAPHGYLLSGGSNLVIDFPSATSTEAFGLNNVGQVIGIYCCATPQSASLGFVLKGGIFDGIEYPGASVTVPRGINDSGTIVGHYSIDIPLSHGFILNGGQYVSFDFPEAPYTELRGINNAGQIVGTYSNVTGDHSFLLSNGIFTPVDFPGEASTFASGINDRGQIVGTYFADGRFHGFVATPIPEPGTATPSIVGFGIMGFVLARKVRA